MTNNKYPTQVEVHQLYSLPLPLQLTEIGEENVYFTDVTGEPYFLKYDGWGGELDIIKELESLKGGTAHAILKNKRVQPSRNGKYIVDVECSRS